MLFYTHSGLRYLVLIAGLAAVLYFFLGLQSKKPYDKTARILNSVFIGLLDTEILIGIIQVISGIYYPQLIGHIAMMLLAAVGVHVASILNKRREQPSYMVALIGVLLAFVFIVGGIMAIGRSIIRMS